MKLFLSSTYEDLANYRNAVMDVLAHFEIVYNAMEIFGARVTLPCLGPLITRDFGFLG